MMRRACWLALVTAMSSAAGSAVAAPGPATLRIAFDKNCYKPGDILTASVIMENLGSPAAGFQAFLQFDNTKLSFLSGSYTAAPFGLHIITPIAASGSDINLAGGVNQLIGQSPTSSDATLAILTFAALGDSGCLGNPGSFLSFRSHDPPTRVSHVDGEPLLPLTLVDSPPFGPGHGTLRLVYNQSCFEPGHPVVVSVRMEDICSPVSGFQAFLHFDTTRLQFVSGSYTAAPFGLPVITPITASGGDIDLASGINQLIGQTPTAGDATLATLTFNVPAGDSCGGSPISAITFRPHDPPTRLANLCGTELSPLTLIDAPPVPAGPATLRLSYDKSCYKTGDLITASIHMEGLCDPAAGFQAFLHYDTTRIAFVSGSYTPAPFGQPVITPITASGGNIDVASGINQLTGQLPTTSDAVVATLTFTAVATNDCSVASTLTFRSHAPPTRVTNLCGQELTPLTLIDAPSIGLDGIAPTIVSPPPIAVQCPGDVPPPATDRTSFLVLPGTSVSDNCDAAPAVAFAGDVISNQTCASRYTITRTYQATDACGNVGTSTQTIVVNDTTPPSVFCPPSLVVPCPSDAPIAADVNGFLAQGGSVSDNCGGPLTLQFVSDVILNQLCPTHYTIVRTYRMLDACGNFLDCGHTIKVFDTLPPTATCPPNVTVQCAADVPVPATDLAGFLSQGGTASDNCAGTVSVSFQGDSISGQTCTNRYTIARTYRITDSCGTFVDCTQTITVNDTTLPTITCPSGLAVQCAADVPAHASDLTSFVSQGGSASDNCGGPVTVEFVSDATSNQTCANRMTITRTYKATDICGNVGMGTQIFTVNDTTAPTINCPASISVNADAGSCGAVVNPGIATASDNCSPAPNITFVREDGLTSLSDPFSSAFNGVGGVGVTEIVWTATDACGNPMSCTQTVTVHAFNELRVSVQLKGANFPASLNRCVTFELSDCNGITPKAVVNQSLTFLSGLATNALVPVPCGNYTCITARDRLHTLRRTDTDDFGAQPITGTQYVADFTDKTLLAGDDDSLIGGNENDDGVVDIIDFALYATQYNTSYGTGDTTCATLAPHGDFSGNGFVFTEDFSFIQINFLKTRDSNCCGAPGIMVVTTDSESKPEISVTVDQLKAKGLVKAAAADLNGNGIVDQADLAAWLMGVRPGQPLPAPAPAPRRR